ncbi:acyl-CoA thioesterase [Actinopolymorpha sp. B9G3]|uniref:acyl-CoA thioesterase n=1 Tax=Actinopolymorpha sp. B9G3 TaxID=3158970 RepID=UPI0032D94302
MTEAFAVPITVRGYELDTQGHLNQAEYLHYAEHARWEFLRSMGIQQDKLLATGVGPVTMETTIRFLRELRGGDLVDVTCAFEWGAGKSFRLVQRFVLSDGTLAAELTAVCGLLDLAERRLVPDPRARLSALADNPDPIDG